MIGNFDFQKLIDFLVGLYNAFVEFLENSGLLALFASKDKTPTDDKTSTNG